MYTIIYTVNTNIDEFGDITDKSLILYADATDDAEITTVLGGTYTLISKWDKDEYTRIFENNKKELFKKLKNYIPRRPRVPLVLEDNTNIEIDGGRDDKDNFKEEHDRLLRNNITITYIKDADNNIHQATVTDVYNAYIAVVDNFYNLLMDKWSKENAIKVATTQVELSNIVI